MDVDINFIYISLPEHMIRFWVDVKTVTIVRPKSRGESELNVPGVREHGDDIGQGQ